MKITVKSEKCIGCGSCVSITNNEIFDFNDEGIAYAKKSEVSGSDAEQTKTAMEYCPTSAIEEVE